MTVSRLVFSRTVAGLIQGTGAKTVEDDAAEVANPSSVLASQAGSLTTRSDDTSGTLTMSSGSHGITTGQRVDLYWADGTCYNATVGTVSGTSVPIASVEGGDVLPAQDTAIKVGIPYQVAFDVIGDNVSALACTGYTGTRCYFVFADAEDAVLLAILLPAGEMYAYDGSGTNPLAELDPVSVWISHDYTAALSTLQAVALRH